MRKSFYITTTLPYVNANPHMGHALEFVQADIIARYKHLCGNDVFLNTGTDEHGLKIYRKADEQKIPIQTYVDTYALYFKKLLIDLNIREHNFIRTTDEAHKKSAQEFWKKCSANGDIYKKDYKIKYCVGCELEKTDSDLRDGKCPEHPSIDIETREEENYFFRFSKYQDKLLKLYDENHDFVVPKVRMNEIKAFVSGGLQDFSISRLKTKMPWGINVPDDDEHVMYVWFDALVNYVSAIGWPDDMNTFKKWWPVVQIAGKDNLRQQAAMWQAMLMSAGLAPSKQILIHGFINSGGQKMSKTLGNVIDPKQLLEKYGTEAARYLLAHEVSTFEDSDVTEERFKEAYNANLANGLGNLVSRVMKMATMYNIELSDEEKEIMYYEPGRVYENLDKYNIQAEMDNIWRAIKFLDEDIQRSEPFKKIKTSPEEAKKDVHIILYHLFGIALRLEPFMPSTSKEIQRLIKENKMPAEPLFKRID